ncbi:MAG: hypothetical protein ABSD64_01060 [Terriglobales bacterium]|jgi:hypothetical protein
MNTITYEESTLLFVGISYVLVGFSDKTGLGHYAVAPASISLLATPSARDRTRTFTAAKMVNDGAVAQNGLVQRSSSFVFV